MTMMMTYHDDDGHDDDIFCSGCLSRMMMIMYQNDDHDDDISCI